MKSSMHSIVDEKKLSPDFSQSPRICQVVGISLCVERRVSFVDLYAASD